MPFLRPRVHQHPPIEPRHECPGGCGEQIPQSLVACPVHWQLLPRALQDAVYETRAARQRQPTNGRLVRAHLAAVADASRYLREHQEHQEQRST